MKIQAALTCNLLFLSLLAPTISMQALEEFSKEYRKSHQVNPDCLIQLDLSFAEVVVTTWDSPQVDIFVKIVTDAKSQERADQIFDKIEVEFGATASKVEFNVNAGSMNCNKNENFTIKVEMKVPAKSTLAGHAGFGEVTISDMIGPCKLRVEYGSLNANSLASTSNNLIVQFGEAKITSAGGGQFSSEYGSVKLGTLKSDATFKTSFGDVKVDQVLAECKNLNVEAEYGDVTMTLASGCAYQVDADCDYGDIEMPSSFHKTTQESDFSGKHVTGTIGTGATGNLRIQCDFGDVSIK